MIFRSKVLFRFALCFAVLFSALGVNKAFASHYASVDMFIDFIGSDSLHMKYRVTLTVYKACEPNSSQLSGSEPLSVSSVNAQFTINRTLPQVGPEDTLDQLCGNFSPINSCRQVGSPWPAFVRRRYIDTITVPARSTDCKFVWTSCCRNAGVQNLSPNQGSTWLECVLNNVSRYNNNSPRYTIDPIPYICLNQPTSFVNGQ
jgi:hypothetical protein